MLETCIDVLNRLVKIDKQGSVVCKSRDEIAKIQVNRITFKFL